MDLDYDSLVSLRHNHPAWRLLVADNAPLVASFLHRTFIAPNVRVMSQADLAERLEDVLYGLRERPGEDLFPRSALQYLADWSANERGWLRKFYPPNSDEPHFDLTPATEKALVWLSSLTQRPFVGTESRLLTLFDLLKQMAEGSETDVQVRLRELHRRRDDIDAEIARVLEGDMPLLDDTALKDRFQQFLALARELLADFREVEQNFRGLDRRVRERVALWEGGKGELLEEILGERDAIADSDQGRSFRAFWDFLMSQRRQEELSSLLNRVLQLQAVTELNPDVRLKRVHYDWLEAGDHTQRTVAQLSQQLRRFLDDQAYLENRRIMDILHGIESKALALRDCPPAGEFVDIPVPAADIELPLERPLYNPPLKPAIASIALEAADTDMDVELLFSQAVVDKQELLRNIRMALQTHPQVTLHNLIETNPLTHGLAELVTYLQIAGDDRRNLVIEDVTEPVRWQTTNGHWKAAKLPRVIFMR
ncbi:MAG TPA: DUF3375 domain-containing protein [Gammaproteobacteria bacterium]